MLRRVLLAALVLSGCRAVRTGTVKDVTPSQEPTADAPATDNGAPKLCAAVRGNGNLIMAHFSSLARITEQYGEIGGIAGGSSGSVTAFFYESLMANPLLQTCNGAPCSTGERNARIALLLKSMQSYTEVLTTVDEAVAFQKLQPIIAKARSLDINRMMTIDVEQARQALLTLLSSPDLRDTINPELLSLVRNSASPQFHVRDLWKSLREFGLWNATDPIIFVRPGFLDFRAVARKIGRAGNYYAGYGPYDKAATEAWMNACAIPGHLKNWPELRVLPAGNSTCGDTYKQMVTAYRQRLIAKESTYPSRIDDPIGKYIPTIAITSVLEGAEAAQTFAAAKERYRNAQPLNWSMDFSNVRAGYWGREADLARIQRNERGYDDIKTQKFLALGAKTWADILSFSPAEPGLTRLLEMSPTRVSAGGWPDPHPVLALKNMGCENVVYLTRRGEEESEFIMGVATLLGMTPSLKREYFSLDQDDTLPPSSYLKSLQEADGVWCTNWNDYDTKDVVEISAQAYNAPFEAHSDFFKSAPNPYPFLADQVHIRSCTPGERRASH